MNIYRTFIAGVLVAVIYLLMTGLDDCNKAGGTYVQGLFWMECVK